MRWWHILIIIWVAGAAFVCRWFYCMAQQNMQIDEIIREQLDYEGGDK